MLEHTTHLASADSFIPFTQEADAHNEGLWIWPGEKPLRIYKNDYDKPPPFRLPLMCGSSFAPKPQALVSQ